MKSMFRALSIRNYRLYASGAMVSNVGTWMQRVAQDWLVLVLTGSPAALGITTGLQFLPILLLSPYAGVIADRFPKRRVLMVTQSALGLTAGLLGLLAVTGLAEVWHVYVLAFLFGAGTAFDNPTRQSFVSEMVDREYVSNAVGLNSASFNLGRVAGPAAAGGLIALFGSGVTATGWVILLNAISYGAVVFSLTRLRVAELHTPERAPRSRGMLRDGFRYVRSRPDVMLILAVAFSAGTFGLNFQMTMAVMATTVYDKGAGEYGILGSVMAVGSLAGALFAARRVSQPRQRLVIMAAVVFAVVEIVAGLMPTYLTFMAVLPLCGLSALTMLTAANSYVQMSVSPEMRGRVMALYIAILMGGTPLGAPLLGWVAEQYGGRWTLIGGGALTLVGILLATLIFARSNELVIRPYILRRPGVAVMNRDEYAARRTRDPACTAA
ncbi:MAG: MFS transporter [Propionibacteriales bacterium]|nr:MFS transporter [Propionibacteriales bacterium]